MMTGLAEAMNHSRLEKHHMLANGVFGLKIMFLVGKSNPSDKRFGGANYGVRDEIMQFPFCCKCGVKITEKIGRYFDTVYPHKEVVEE